MESSFKTRSRPGLFARRADARARLVLVAATAAGLGGCGADRVATNPQPAASAISARPTPTPPPIAMGGRWQLSSPGGASCAVTFGAPAGAVEGAMAPEGGCPGDFYTARKWTSEGGMLVVRDHTGKPLGELAFAGGRFEGKSSAGQPISLAR